MDKKRFLGMIVGATLIIAVVLVALGYSAAPTAKGSSASSEGFGDLRRFEGQSAPKAEISDRQRSELAYSGRYEAMAAAYISSAAKPSAETLRYEAMALHYTAGQNSIKARQAEAARWEKLAGHIPASNQSYNPVAARAAEAARWTAMAETSGK
jgi:hypothetical protein